MSEPTHIVPDLLIAAGAQADAHAEDLFVSHTAADATVDSALAGWVGRSAAALSARAAVWAAATAELSIRIGEFGQALRLTGVHFAEMEYHHADAAAGVHHSGSAS